MSPSVYDYQDYRKYLADFYAAKKEAQPSFSHRAFATQARLGSPSYLLMIIRGERNLSAKTLPKISEALKLNVKEREYFELLVQFNQSDDPETRTRYFEQLLKFRKLSAPKSLEKENYEFLSKWYVVAIYVLVDTNDFVADPRWIVARLKNRISVNEAAEALRSLQALGMIEPHPENGFTQKAGALSAADDTRSVAVFQYHSSMIKLAHEALRRDRVTDREMNGVTIAIPKDQLPVFKEKIRAFRKELNSLASSMPNADEVYQVNIQMFALTEEKDA